MNKRTLTLLERAYTAEIDAAITKQGSGLLHTKSKLAAKLVEDGYLSLHELDAGKECIYGYALTHAGRIAYCAWASENEGEKSK